MCVSPAPAAPPLSIAFTPSGPIFIMRRSSRPRPCPPSMYAILRFLLPCCTSIVALRRALGGEFYVTFTTSRSHLHFLAHIHVCATPRRRGLRICPPSAWRPKNMGEAHFLVFLMVSRECTAAREYYCAPRETRVAYALVRKTQLELPVAVSLKLK